MVLDFKFKPYETKGHLNYTCYLTHGVGGGRTAGAKIAAVRKLREVILTDIYICGHVHGMGAYKDAYFTVNTRAGKIDKMTQLYALSSAFLEWGGYSEDLVLTPSKLGTSRIRIDGKKKDFHVSI